MFRRISYCLGAMLALVCIGCDKVPLLAPTSSTVTIDAQSRVLPTGGSTSVTATVLEQGGTPVQNGTLVRFTTTLGRMEPAEAQTRNGIATTTFFAGDDSGIAEVRATSGGAGGATTSTPGTGGTPGTTTTTNTNVVQIAVGAGAVDSVTVRANPSTVSNNGGTVALIATVVGTGGRALSGITVSFSATRGTLSSTTAATDAQGEARVNLTTNGDTDVTAAAGTKNATAKITGQPGPQVVLTCTAGTATNCASATVGQTVNFNASRAQGSANLTAATLDFGDNQSLNLGTLSSATNVPHVYAQAGTYTARLTGTAANGETAESTQIVGVGSGVNLLLDLTANGLTVTARVTVSGGVAVQFAWNFEGGANANYITSVPEQSHTYATGASTKTVTVTVTLGDGSTRVLSRSITLP